MAQASPLSLFLVARPVSVFIGVLAVELVHPRSCPSAVDIARSGAGRMHLAGNP